MVGCTVRIGVGVALPVLPTLFCVPVPAPSLQIVMPVVAAEIVAPALEGEIPPGLLAPIPTGIAAFVAWLCPGSFKNTV